MQQLKDVASARTKQEYEEQVKRLQESEVWLSSPRFCQYMSKKWLPNSKVGLVKKMACTFKVMSLLPAVTAKFFCTWKVMVA